MKKIIFLFFSLCFLTFIKAQDLVPLLNTKGWQLYDKSKTHLFPEIYKEAIPAKNLIIIRENNYWGAINRKGEVILPMKFEVITQYKSGLIHAKHNDKIQLYTNTGVLIQKKYFLDATEYKNDSSYIVVKGTNNKFGIISISGKTIIPLIYSYAPEHFLQKYLKVGVDKNLRPLYGLLDAHFKTFIPISYKEILQLPKGNFLCHLPNGNYDVYDTSGKLIWTGEHKVTNIYENYFTVKKDDINGVFFRKTGKTIWIEGSMEVVEKSNSVLCTQEATNEYFIYDESGKKFSYPGFNLSYRGGKYLQMTKKQTEAEEESNLTTVMSLADFSGKEILKKRYELMKDWTDEYCIVGKIQLDEKNNYKQKFGIIKIANGDTLLEIDYDDIQLFIGGFATFKNETWKLYSFDGKRAGNNEYAAMNSYDRRMMSSSSQKYLHFVKRKEGKYQNGADIFLCGYINDSCKEVIPSNFIHIEELKDRYGNTPPQKMFMASKPDSAYFGNGKFALLNKNYEAITPYKYMSVGPYWDKYIIMENFDYIDGETRRLAGIMDTLGNIVVKPFYDNIELVHPNGFIAMKNGRMCFLNKSGKEIIPLKYQRISFLTDRLIKVKNMDQEGIYDITGKEYFKPGRYEILEGNFLEGTLIKVKAPSKNEPNKEVVFYVDMQGKEYRE